tara:strand:+ start:648 stop:1067 length:420 start_codon:yes stop_codon:yes gene_type:complete
MKSKDSKTEDFQTKIKEPGFINKKQIVKKTRSSSQKDIGIPKEVANRMARRIAITTGIPTLFGMGVFILSYYLITEGIAEIAPVITLVSSGSFFLLGLIGLSYGILSASWDKDSGSFLGIENISPNITRMKAAFKTKEL